MTKGAAGNVVYDDSVSLSPIAITAKITASAASVAHMRFNKRVDYDSFGRIYLWLSASPPSTIRLVHWQQVGDPRGHIEINGARKVVIRDQDGNALATSTTVLPTATAHRLEWDVTRSGSAGVVTLRIYTGHGTSALETLTTSGFNTGTYVDTFLFGSVNNSNLASMILNVGAYADGCRTQPGVYTGPPDNLWEARNDYGQLYAAVNSDGESILFASQTLQMDGGRHKVRPGRPILRVDRYGNQYWGPDKLAKKETPGATGSMHEGYAITTGRVHGHSFTAEAVNDPPDITLVRANVLSIERSGTDGQGSGSSFTSVTAGFTPIDLDKKIRIAGTDYWIANVDSASTVTLDDVNDDPVTLAGSGLAWEMFTPPYPQRLTGTRGPIGQVRTAPYAFPFIRSGSDGETNNSTTFTAQSGAFTAADVDRAIMIDNDTARIYEIVAVNSSTSVTLSAVDTAVESGLAWSISGSEADAGAIELPFNNGTIGFNTDNADMRIWDASATKVTAPADLLVSLARADRTYSGGQAAELTLALRSDGDLEVSRGNLEVLTAGKGLRVKEGSNAKMGLATLSSGTVVVNTTAVTASSRIFLTKNSGASSGSVRVSARTAGTSFTITSSDAADTGTVAWMIMEPA